MPSAHVTSSGGAHHPPATFGVAGGRRGLEAGAPLRPRARRRNADVDPAAVADRRRRGRARRASCRRRPASSWRKRRGPPPLPVRAPGRRSPSAAVCSRGPHRARCDRAASATARASCRTRRRGLAREAGIERYRQRDGAGGSGEGEEQGDDERPPAQSCERRIAQSCERRIAQSDERRGAQRPTKPRNSSSESKRMKRLRRFS